MDVYQVKKYLHLNSGNGMVMVLKQVKQLNTIDAIHLYHDAFGKKMLRNAKGRWCAPKSRKKHHGDASVKLHDAVTRLKLDTCPAFDIGGENHDFYTGSLHRTACTEK